MTVDTPRLELTPTLGLSRLLTRGTVARTIVHATVAGMPVRLRYPDGTEVGGGGPDSPVLEVVRPHALFRRLETHPKIGLGEGYMAGDWRAAPGTDLADAPDAVRRADGPARPQAAALAAGPGRPRDPAPPRRTPSRDRAATSARTTT